MTLRAAKSGFKLPLTVEFRDADMSLLREFTVQRSGKTTLGKTADDSVLYVFPIIGIACDATGRRAIVKLDATRVDVKSLN